MCDTLALHMRSQRLSWDKSGHRMWRPCEQTLYLPADQVGIIVCDVWDDHWSRGARERLEVMLPRMDAVLRSARALGAHIIHAPSNTVAFYNGHPARTRICGLEPLREATLLDHANPPLPIDDSDGGSDTGETVFGRPWRRQHHAIHIDPARDTISDDGREVLGYAQRAGIRQLLILGVHTNMCVLNRTFAIKQMTRWGMPIALVRDLTDTMYNPALRPYVSRDEGTRLVVGYIEKHWCPSLLSEDLL